MKFNASKKILFDENYTTIQGCSVEAGVESFWWAEVGVGVRKFVYAGVGLFSSTGVVIWVVVVAES